MCLPCRYHWYKVVCGINAAQTCLSAGLYFYVKGEILRFQVFPKYGALFEKFVS